MTATVWAVVPAAGIGSRMMTSTPKQYLPINGRAVLAHTLERLGRVTAIRQIVVALHPQDRLWQRLGIEEGVRLRHCDGGANRCESVLSALAALQDEAADDDLVLVHDAVRPCVSVSDIEHVIATAAEHPAGALLAIPASSTLKKADQHGNVITTLDRSDIWKAATPQVFRYDLLHSALTGAIAAGFTVTDESSALEMAGYAPRLVRGSADNIKITFPEHLHMAEMILARQERDRSHGDRH